MRPGTIARTALASLASLLLLAGCSDHAPTSPSTQSIQITPANGTTGVKVDAAISVDFGKSVDRATVEAGIHLMSEADLYAPCPYSMPGYHGTMDELMNDPVLMHHMDQYHSTHGHYSWNGAGTVCTFHPDSLMRSPMTYMVHLSGNMLGAVGMRGRMTDCHTNSAGDVMTHFQTASPVAP